MHNKPKQRPPLTTSTISLQPLKFTLIIPDETIDAKLRVAEDGLRAVGSAVEVLAPAEGYSREF